MGHIYGQYNLWTQYYGILRNEADNFGRIMKVQVSSFD